MVAACVVSAPRTSGAQGNRQVEPSAAELAIAVGRLDVAESALYAAAARAPREPSARGALGAFLAARGKFLVGATLLDEALRFGADTAAIEMRQFEVYRWTGEYGRVAALRTVRLSPPARAALRRSAGTHAGGTDAATVELQPNEAPGLGRIVIRVGGVRVSADVEPLSNGLVLPSSEPLFRAIEPAGAHGDTTFGVARTVSVGTVTLGPVPVALVPSLGVARIGLDVLSLLTPTFDHDARTLTVHSSPYAAVGQRLPILLTFPGVTFVATDGQGPVGVHTSAGHAALRGARWTLEVAAGAIIVAR